MLLALQRLARSIHPHPSSLSTLPTPGLPSVAREPSAYREARESAPYRGQSDVHSQQRFFCQMERAEVTVDQVRERLRMSSRVDPKPKRLGPARAAGTLRFCWTQR